MICNVKNLLTVVKFAQIHNMMVITKVNNWYFTNNFGNFGYKVSEG